jgi:lambda family phage tail tape measure protein
MADRNISIAISAIDQTHAAWNSLTNQLNNARSQLSDLGTAGAAASDRLQRSFNALNIKSGLQIDSEKTRILAAFEQIRSSGVASASEVSRAHQAMRARLQELNTQINGVSGSFMGFGSSLLGAFGVLSSGAVLSGIFNAGVATDRLKNSFEVVTGSAQAGSDALAYVRAESNRLGIDLQSSSKAFLGLSAAAKGTALEGDKTRAIFSAVAESSRALGLTSDETNGALLAIGQMMSKGTVQAEELRGQLGERLPGAFQIAATAMGVSTVELGKMLQQGQVLSDDFLPKFAAELQRTFSAGEKTVSGVAAQVERLKNAVFDLASAIAGSGLSSSFSGIAKQITEDLGSIGRAIKAAGELDDIIRHPLTPHGAPIQDTPGTPMNSFDAAVMSITDPTTAGTSTDWLFTQKSKLKPTWTVDAAAREVQAEEFAKAKKTKKPKKVKINRTEDQNAYAASELERTESYGEIDQTRDNDLEKTREWLRQKKLLYEQETISESDWIEFQKQAKEQEAEINATAIRSKISALNTEWRAKQDHYRDGKELDRAYAQYSQQYDKLLLDYKKTTNEKQAALDDAAIAQAKRSKKEREEAEKLARTKVDLEKARQLAAIETEQASGAITATEAMTQKLAVMQSIVALEDERLGQLRRDSTEEQILWNQQAQKVEEYKKQVADLQKTLRLRTAWGGFQQAVQDYQETISNMGKQVQETLSNAFTGAEDALVNFCKTGKLSFKSLVDSILTDLLRIYVRQQIMGPLVSGISSAVGSIAASFAHSGGLIMHSGGLVPRFHFGGLASDEVPAILQTRERVLSREQASLFEKFANKTENSGNVQVNVINQTGRDVDAEQSAPRFDGEQMIVNVVLKKMKSDPSFRAALAGGR